VRVKGDVPALMPELCASGLNAIEAYHSDHTPKDTELYLGLARRYGLHVTGGSDYHGAIKPNVRLGSLHVPDDLVDRLRAGNPGENPGTDGTFSGFSGRPEVRTERLPAPYSAHSNTGTRGQTERFPVSRGAPKVRDGAAARPVVGSAQRRQIGKNWKTFRLSTGLPGFRVSGARRRAPPLRRTMARRRPTSLPPPPRPPSSSCPELEPRHPPGPRASTSCSPAPARGSAPRSPGRDSSPCC